MLHEAGHCTVSSSTALATTIGCGGVRLGDYPLGFGGAGLVWALSSSSHRRVKQNNLHPIKWREGAQTDVVLFNFVMGERHDFAAGLASGASRLEETRQNS